MSNVIIVAIPKDRDDVWEFSSEKIPHVTLIYLDEGAELNKVADFVEHSASMMLTQFELSVSKRGTLGEDKADVVFFDDWVGIKSLTEFRDALLQNDHIQKFKNTKFPIWTPHLTLGYPDRPAKAKVGNRNSPYWIEFDKIAVWDGDFQGPTFELKNHDYMEVAMSDLEHHGVKGQKWGVRRSVGTNGTVSVTAKSTNGKAKVKTTGGGGAKPHADAIAARIGSQKLKKSGLNSLSNDELRQLVTRLQLERQVKDLNTKGGEKYVKNLLAQEGKQRIPKAVVSVAKRVKLN